MPNGCTFAAASIQRFTVPGAGSITKLAAGANGSVYFAADGNKLSLATAAGALTPIASVAVSALHTGPDRTAWYADQGASRIGRLTGAAATVWAFPRALATGPRDFAFAADGSLWYAATGGLGRFAPEGGAAGSPGT